MTKILRTLILEYKKDTFREIPESQYIFLKILTYIDFGFNIEKIIITIDEEFPSKNISIDEISVIDITINDIKEILQDYQDDFILKCEIKMYKELE